MSKTNCINCGAAKDTDEIKCPFCGTTYLDLTAIDFSSDDPVVCQFVLPDYDASNMYAHGDMCKHNKHIISMLAIPRLNSITAERNCVEIYGCGNRPIGYVNTGWDINFAVEFKPIAKRSDNTLFSVKVK